MLNSISGATMGAPAEPDRDVPCHTVGLRDVSFTYTVNAFEPREFDKLLAGFDDICFDQLSTYRSGQWPGRTHSFLSYRDDQLIGGAVLVAFSAPVLGRGVADLRFGPFWRRHGETPDPANYDAIVKQLIHEFTARQRHMLTIKPCPSPVYAALESEALAAHGFRRRPAPGEEFRYLVDVTISTDEQMNSLGQEWRTNLREAQKNGLTVEHDDSDEAIAIFQDMHHRMVDRRNIGVTDPTHLVGTLIRELPDNMKARNYLVRHKGKPVAGAIVMNTGDTAHCLFGAREDEALALRAGYALQWEIIRSLNAEPVSYYDLGGNSGHDGLHKFKSGLAGRAGHTIPLPDEFDFWSTPDSYVLGKSFQLARYVKRHLI